jgi:group I intron endonuclease
MKISCIYKIANVVNGNKYIGSTINYNRRQKRHILFLNRGNHHSRYLQNAWNFYGKDKFEFSIVELVDDVSKLIEREDYYTKLWKPEYNTMKDIKSHLGLKRSFETLRKMSLAHVGKTHSEETKEKIRQITTGVKQTKETVAKRMENKYKPIIQCDLDGNVVREWESATHASLNGTFNRKCIYRCIWGKRSHYKGFIWKEKR